MKQRAYSMNKICFTGPQWVLGRARSSSLLKEALLFEIDEFVDNERTYIPRDKSIIRKRLGISEDEIMILNVAPSGDERKGVKDFISIARMVSNIKLRFVNVGNQEDTNSLPENYLGVPYVKDQIELSQYYSSADILFCTSHADTMPNVCLEALSCGTPIIGYNTTGIPYIAPDPLGIFFDFSDTGGIIDYLDGLKRKTNDIEIECREYSVKRYSVKTYVDRQLSIYNQMISDN